MDFERLQKIITIRPELHKATLKEIKKMSKSDLFLNNIANIICLLFILFLLII